MDKPSQLLCTKSTRAAQDTNEMTATPRQPSWIKPPCKEETTRKGMYRSLFMQYQSKKHTMLITDSDQ